MTQLVRTRVIALVALALGALVPQSAGAYLSAGFVKIPGIPGGWRAAPHRTWIRAEGHYWKGSDVAATLPRHLNFFRRAVFSGPAGPRNKADALVVAVSKRDPSIPRLMARCSDKTRLPEIIFAESSEMVRGAPELGERPATIPAFFEYKLKDVEVSECPVIKVADEQAFVLKFNNIEWANYVGSAEAAPLTLPPSALPAVAMSGRTKTFVVSWIGNVGSADKNQCAATNDKPTLDDYMTHLSGEDADKARARLKASGGALNYGGGGVARRGPNFLNICQIPGIVPSPLFHMPRATIVPGLDLDGDGGARSSRRDVPYLRSYTSPDGRKGIDNQMFAVTGCIPGMQGRNGFLDQYSNEEMRNGFVSPMVMISGIDDDHNDNEVWVSILYSKDSMAKHASGRDILSDYTFRLSNEPQFAHYFRSLRGRIVGGVIETDPVDRLEINRSYAQLAKISQARLRLEIAQDGSLKGVIGGYVDWRAFMSVNGGSQYEQLAGFQCPGLYHALKKAADGLKNPETGEYEGISTAYEIEGRPAFIPSSQTVSIFSQAQAAR